MLWTGKIDNFMIKMDGTKFKSKLGANAILGVSVAIAKLGAKMLNQSLYRYLGGINAKTMPVPMMNILNGGAHADNALDFQEFMIIPFGAKDFPHALQMGTEIYHHLKKILKEKKIFNFSWRWRWFCTRCKINWWSIRIYS